MNTFRISFLPDYLSAGQEQSILPFMEEYRSPRRASLSCATATRQASHRNGCDDSLPRLSLVKDVDRDEQQHPGWAPLRNVGASGTVGETLVPPASCGKCLPEVHQHTVYPTPKC